MLVWFFMFAVKHEHVLVML